MHSTLRNNPVTWLVAGLLTALLLATLVATHSARTQHTSQRTCIVSYLVDGDTLVCRDATISRNASRTATRSYPTPPPGGSRTLRGQATPRTYGGRLRLAGIDALELDQPYGWASLTGLAELVQPGDTLHLQPLEVDKYGRLVAWVYVYIPNSPPNTRGNVSLAMVARGYAITYDYDNDGTGWFTQLREAQRSAELYDIGLHAHDAFQCNPASYRRGWC